MTTNLHKIPRAICLNNDIDLSSACELEPLTCEKFFDLFNRCATLAGIRHMLPVWFERTLNLLHVNVYFLANAY